MKGYNPDSVWNTQKPKLKERYHYKHIEKIVKALEKCGCTVLCPCWNWVGQGHAHREEDCQICRGLFPRLIKEKCCPCRSTYKTQHLINVLKTILRANIHLSPKYRLGGKE